MNKDAKYLPDIFFCTNQKWLVLTNIDLWSMKRTHNWCCIRGICWDNRAVIDPWIKKDIGKIPCYYSFGGNFVLFISLLVIFWLLQHTFLVVLKTVFKQNYNEQFLNIRTYLISLIVKWNKKLYYKKRKKVLFHKKVIHIT